MPHFNVEIKARCDDHNKIRKILLANDADFKGMDHQVDTYFNVGTGRSGKRKKLYSRKPQTARLIFGWGSGVILLNKCPISMLK